METVQKATCHMGFAHNSVLQHCHTHTMCIMLIQHVNYITVEYHPSHNSSRHVTTGYTSLTSPYKDKNASGVSVNCCWDDLFLMNVYGEKFPHKKETHSTMLVNDVCVLCILYRWHL